MRVEVLAVGTELLLGQIANTNAAWLGEQMAARGVDSHYGQVVGDNHDRIVRALRTALARADGVIVCGGLGPTQDDITREAIAEVMGVELVRDPALVDVIASFFNQGIYFFRTKVFPTVHYAIHIHLNFSGTCKGYEFFFYSHTEAR